MKTRTIKKLTFIVASIGIFSSIYAQQPIKNENISTDYITLKAKLGGAIDRLSSDKYYKIIFPTQMNHYKDKQNEKLWSDMYISMDAKKAKGDAPANKIFEIVTPGATIIDTWIQIKPGITMLSLYEPKEVDNPSAYGMKAWVGEIKYKYPVKLIVKNGDGSIEKEITLSDTNQIYTATYHQQFFKENAFEGKEGWIKPAVPFNKKEELEKSSDVNRIAIETRIERNHTIDIRDAIAKTIYLGYDYAKIPKSFFYFYTLKQNVASSYGALAQQIATFIQAMKDFQEDEKRQSSTQTLGKCADYFKQQLQQPSLPKDIVKLLSLDGAYAALFSGNTKDADELFTKFYVGFKPDATTEYGMPEEFPRYYATVNTYYTLKNNRTNTVSINNTLSAFTENKKFEDNLNKEKQERAALAKAEQDAKNPNIKNVEGYAVMKNGEKYMGRVSINFIQDPNESKGIVDMDLGNVAKVIFTKNGNETYQMCHAKQTSYLMINERCFEPINLKVGTLGGIGNVLSGNFNSLQFAEKIYTEGNYVLYNIPTYGNTEKFVLYKKGDDKAYAVKDILNQSKPAKRFIDNCPQLIAKLASNEYNETLNSIKAMMEFLNKRCK